MNPFRLSSSSSSPIQNNSLKTNGLSVLNSPNIADSSIPPSPKYPLINFQVQRRSQSTDLNASTSSNGIDIDTQSFSLPDISPNNHRGESYAQQEKNANKTSYSSSLVPFSPPPSRTNRKRLPIDERNHQLDVNCDDSPLHNKGRNFDIQKKNYLFDNLLGDETTLDLLDRLIPLMEIIRRNEEEASEETKQMKCHLKRTQEELFTYQSQLKESNHQYTRLVEQITKFQKVGEDCHLRLQHYKEINSKCSSQLKNSENTISRLVNFKDSISQKYHQQEAEYRELTIKMESQNKENEQISLENKKLQSALSESNDREKDLTSRLEISKKTLDDVQQQYSDKSDKYDALMKEYENIRCNNQNLEKSLKNASEIQKNLEDRIRHLSCTLEDITLELANAKVAFNRSETSYKASLEEYQNFKESTEREVKKMMETITEKEFQFQENILAKEKMKVDYDEMIKELEIRLSQSMDHLRVNKEKSDGEIATLKSLVEEKEEMISTLSKKIDHLESDIQISAKSHNEYQLKVKEDEEARQQCNKTLHEKIERENRELLQKEYADLLKIQKIKFDNELCLLENKYKSLDQTTNALREENEKLAKELQNYHTSNDRKSKKNDHDEICNERDSSKKDTAGIFGIIQSLESDLNNIVAKSNIHRTQEKQETGKQTIWDLENNEVQKKAEQRLSGVSSQKRQSAGNTKTYSSKKGKGSTSTRPTRQGQGPTQTMTGPSESDIWSVLDSPHSKI